MTSLKSRRVDKKETPSALRHAQSHDYAWLIKRWKVVARTAGLKMVVFAEADSYPVYWLESRSVLPESPRIYISAGIHGDESAPTEALLLWAQSYPEVLQNLNLTLFPCMNPWGLTHNKRSNEIGCDLNRCYRNGGESPVIRCQLNLLERKEFDAALCLHEDYDAHGVYLYEIARVRPYLGEKIISAMSRHIPVESRKNVDGNRAKAGVIRRKLPPKLLEMWPEAFALHFMYSLRTLTIETPSEFGIDQRVAAHVAAISEVVRLIG
jgi:hypothetical protein